MFDNFRRFGRICSVISVGSVRFGSVTGFIHSPKFTESTEGSGPGLRNLSENDDLSVPECSSGSGSNY